MLNSMYNSSTQDNCQGSHVLVVSSKGRVDTVLDGFGQPFSSEFDAMFLAANRYLNAVFIG
jgi:hypothetical protein